MLVCIIKKSSSLWWINSQEEIKNEREEKDV